MYITVAYIWSHDLHMYTGISKNRGIGSLQYRYAKKNDTAHPYLHSGSILTYFVMTDFSTLLNDILHKTQSSSSIIYYCCLVCYWLTFVDDVSQCFLLQVIFQLHFIVNFLTVGFLFNKWYKGWIKPTMQKESTQFRVYLLTCTSFCYSYMYCFC